MGADTPAGAARPGAADRRRRDAWRWAGTAAAIVIAAAAIAAFAFRGSPSAPDMAAAAALHKAATVALGQSLAAPLEPGTYLYVKSEGVALVTTSLGDDAPVVRTHVATVREVWMGAHSRRRETQGEPAFVTPRDGEIWIAQGSPDLGRAGTSTVSLGAYKPAGLPTEPAKLFRRIRAEALGHGDGLDEQMFVLVGDHLRETVTSPAQRAALFEVAARIPGVELVGRVADSAGRPGIAVAMTGTTDHIRQTLIIDQRTAQLLAEEETVVAGNDFGWPAGSLVDRTTYLVTATVASNTAVPAMTR